MDPDRAELTRRLGIDSAVLTEADVEWFVRELLWIARARAQLDEALAEANDSGWSLTGDRRTDGRA